MTIYIVDRTNKARALLSEEVEKDTLVDDLETGVRSLELTLTSTELVRKTVHPGRYILLDEDKAFEITNVRSESDTVTVYAEDAGTDLIHKMAAKWAPTSAQTLISAIQTAVGNLKWAIDLHEVDPTTTAAASNLQREDETVLARLQAIASAYDLELYFTYNIDALKLYERTINFVGKRGREKDDVFRVGDEVESITLTESTEELATGYILYGADETALSSMSDYSTYVGEIAPSDGKITTNRRFFYRVRDDTVECIDMMEEWSNSLDDTGLILGIKSTEYSTARDLISYAIRELEKHADVEMSYEVRFNAVAADVSVGDTILIADETSETYVTARIGKTTKSYTEGTVEIELTSFSKI